MKTDLNSVAEKEAKKAEELPAFSGLKVRHIKSQISQLLSMIGKQGFFSEYTKHDISHIDEMLSLADWLVPKETQKIMTPADWLLITLAIYLHDLGLLVTEAEFAKRDDSGFSSYVERAAADSTSSDYLSKVSEVYHSPEMRERFFYQEFVRHNHAERVRRWIAGDDYREVGCSDTVAEAVNALLQVVDPKFREDLGLVCASHHRDDLGDTSKYPVSQPYGSLPSEAANVHYASLILRTADLLHVTRDRTPSLEFRVLNPIDPVSQEEWAKQQAVRSVRSQPGRNKEGIPEPNAERDTVEIHAFFTKPAGFFGLTSYLNYADNQLKKSYEWADRANKREGAKHKFPWRVIDDSNIRAKGFLTTPFSFRLNDAKILDLLTGHTLYNETDVVLRELVQNALDAVRLQSDILSAATLPYNGRVEILWNSRARLLTVKDNGTGMTQEIIEKHLLSVGASRYQEPEFRKAHPSFSPISRFGIGVLSCFMVADEIEIFTCTAEADEVRHLQLRSVHGRYLIRLLQKKDVEPGVLSMPHGTTFQLRIRLSASLFDILAAVKKWIMFAGCEVVVCIDKEQPVAVGYETPSDALLSFLRRGGHEVVVTERLEGDNSAVASYNLVPENQDLGVAKIKIVERREGAVTVAYALRWSEYFREWSFYVVDLRDDRYQEEDFPFGVCIEGVRVEFGTPGFESIEFAAVANATGIGAPKTNVARTSIERTSEGVDALRSLYRCFVGHVAMEVNELHKKRGFSLTWAAGEGEYLLAPLSRTRTPRRADLLEEEISRLPLQVVEQDERRRVVSRAYLAQQDSFWTVDGQLFRAAESLVREVSGTASVSRILAAMDEAGVELPPGMFLAGAIDTDSEIFVGKEVTKIRILRENRRVDLFWAARRDEAPRWVRLRWSTLRKILSPSRAYVRGGRSAGWEVPDLIERLWVGAGEVEVEGVQKEFAVSCNNAVFVLQGSDLAGFLVDRIRDFEVTDDVDALADSLLSIRLVLMLLGRDLTEMRQAENFWEYVGLEFFPLEGTQRGDELRRLLSVQESLAVFDPSKWRRSTDSER